MPEQGKENPRVDLVYPSNFPDPILMESRNPLTREGIILGRMLFFDPALSGNDSISCASCHLPDKAFADAGRAFSQVQAHFPTKRHVPALINLAWMPTLFWDGGVKNLESLPLAALLDSAEMLQDLRSLEQELMPKYRSYFKAACNRDTVTLAMVFNALAQFQRTMISADSPYDRWRKDSVANPLPHLAFEGLRVVQTKCSPCHREPLFTDNEFHNNGLDTTYSEAHLRLAYGHGRISEDSSDIGKFKTPTLRNVMLTPPYMHDGRFADIDEVLDHYEKGVLQFNTLDSLLLQDGKVGISLTMGEREAIKAFLPLLTDRDYPDNVLRYRTWANKK